MGDTNLLQMLVSDEPLTQLLMSQALAILLSIGLLILAGWGGRVLSQGLAVAPGLVYSTVALLIVLFYGTTSNIPQGYELSPRDLGFSPPWFWIAIGIGLIQIVAAITLFSREAIQAGKVRRFCVLGAIGTSFFSIIRIVSSVIVHT